MCCVIPLEGKQIHDVVDDLSRKYLDRLDNGAEIVECDVPTFPLCSHLCPEITSRPLPVRILQQADLSIGIIRISPLGSRHIHR